ncbi:hypothetical protein dsat_2146 [Alkalidesulfovibrio alkalitolerans DSM 16529]|jgi:predicted DNA binding CopG/RHH family protein|uniref:Antitoxin n=1 Tax=Alkalidesulfovibrio alkalitolerans DSM 16529 TaxID=1121439 RepID=S7TFR7_9BACT|nr:hypothetical protein [Alkalidesulfovibrio alkalitolerans]EPR35445.1 hypothetical protein dsat_2146 [Alkalidesulfovibrio alkalitolerans DSM 16529]
MSAIDREEQELLESYEKGEWKPLDPDARARYETAAREMFRKDRRLNIRISGRDLDRIKRRALIEGIPYQTLIASVLHKYASGRLRERDDA